jgi:hypothetical protein
MSPLRRRKTDKNPGRESLLESRVVLLDEEVNLLRAENRRLQLRVAALMANGGFRERDVQPTRPAELAP